jgi:UDP-N-acetylmuramate dehydrogenase
MQLASEIRSLFPDLCVLENRLLKDYTTFRLGGPCPVLIDNPSPEELPGLARFLHEKQTPFLTIGQGSNLVISDEGLEQVIIRFCSEQPNISLEGNRVTVSGSTLLTDLADYTVEQAIGDLTPCCGIPGTVGGGIAGNAGAFGFQLGDYLVSAQILGSDGEVRTVSPEDLDFSYRNSRLKESGETVLYATLELPAEQSDTLRAERDRILEFRREHHPDWHADPCAGSVFRNIEPTSAVERRKAAGWFLEEAGAKSFRVGGAKIYEKHANIIVAEPGCRAQDVWEISEQMRLAVKGKFNMDLVREVRFLGSFNPSA